MFVKDEELEEENSILGKDESQELELEEEIYLSNVHDFEIITNIVVSFRETMQGTLKRQKQNVETRKIRSIDETFSDKFMGVFNNNAGM